MPPSVVAFLALLLPAAAQVPPLQWINLSSIIQSSNGPPALKDAAIGYDENSRSIIVFGGESQGGISQSQTYLLDLDKLTWSTPSPPATLNSAPPARSAAIAGIDFAASYRHGFVVIGGKGAQGQALSDVWEYDFINQFWSQVSVSSSIPSPRWGASGGIDVRVSPVQDPRLASPNNTFYLAGGTSGSHADPLSDVWRFNISGTLSSNLPASLGSWDHFTISNLPTQVGQGGTVAYDQIVSVGGCNSTSNASPSCAQQSSYVLTVDSDSFIAPQPCPPPRYRPAIVSNLNAYSSSFANQVFVISGLYNTSLWDDGGDFKNGEIDVLDFKGGTWTRVLPSGDPGSNGQTTYPVPRQGAAAVGYSQGLVGSNRDASSDVIMFGGQDTSGQYLSDLWLLRSYNGSVSASSPNWSGYGNGQLGTGINADGSGVKVQFPSKCASRLTIPRTPTTTTTTTSSSSRATSTGSSSFIPSSTIYNISIIHKIFAPLSVALLLPSVVYFRLTLSTFTDYKLPEHRLHWFYMSATVSVVAYAFGVVGLAFSFTSISSATRSFSAVLQTSHGQAGLAFFACLYGIVPVLFSLRYLVARATSSEDGNSIGTDHQNNSISEKPASLPGPVGSMTQSTQTSAPPSPRGRSHSLGAVVRPKTAEGGLSSDTESFISSPTQRGFEVVNRPPRIRHPGGNWTQGYAESSRRHLNPGSLGDIDWLLRRRSLNAVDELDYAITQLHNARLETPATMDPLLSVPSTHNNSVVLPSLIDIVLHVVLHASLLGICIISLIALWSRAPRFAFALFLAWTILFYVVILSLSWFGRPEKSILTVVVYRLRRVPPSSASGQVLRSPQNDQPSMHDGPYLHHPPYRHATREEIAQARPLSMTTDDEDDNVDEDTRQRMIEEEMERRDVSIVTIPRRKLWITNPS
ncbi:hypothetical protein APHAL10511_001843 [Amanita phalloides]|nr:hypothetical protein APHAL10511_001843 [Amanita phalloides]